LMRIGTQQIGPERKAELRSHLPCRAGEHLG
jgi:hypothetical protein